MESIKILNAVKKLQLKQQNENFGRKNNEQVVEIL